MSCAPPRLHRLACAPEGARLWSGLRGALVPHLQPRYAVSRTERKNKAHGHDKNHVVAVLTSRLVCPRSADTRFHSDALAQVTHTPHRSQATMRARASLTAALSR